MNETKTCSDAIACELVPYGTTARHRRQIQRLSRLRCAAERRARQARYAEQVLCEWLDDMIDAMQHADRDAERAAAKADGRADTIRRLVGGC